VDDVTCVALHNFRLRNIFCLLDDELSFYVKPRSTTWFSHFLIEQYDDQRWMQMFRMTQVVFSLANSLRPHVEKHDTKYRLSIPVIVCVCYTLFKFTHGANLFIYNEMFAVGKNIVSMVLREVVHAINDALRHEISWPTGE
jgi:low temperature requirement protein LtrA